MSLFESISSKLTLKEVGTHLRNYAELYSRPLKIWKKIISNRKDGYNLVILHLIYYCIFIFFIVKEVTLAIPLAILEAAITIVPLLIFLLPFVFFTKLFKKQYKWNKLFRLFLIIKLQFIPIFILLILVVQYLKVENLYLITDNSIWIIWLAFIIIFPAIINLNFWKKLIWIFTNYIFFLLGASILVYLLNKVDSSGKIFSKLSMESPNSEYTNFELKGLYSPLLFADTYYFIHVKGQNDTTLSASKTQFVSFNLRLSFMQTKLNTLRSDMKYHDSLIILYNKKFKDTINIHKKEELSKSDNTKELTLPFLDTLRAELNSKFYSLLKESKRLKDSAKFESNREYFTALTNYLLAYEKSYSDPVEINRILAASTLEGTIRFDSTNWGSMFMIDSNYYSKTKNRLKSIESNFVKRSNRSTFLQNILFYPEELILDKLGYFD